MPAPRLRFPPRCVRRRLPLSRGLAHLTEAMRIRCARIIESAEHVERRARPVNEPLDPARPRREIERADQRSRDAHHAESEPLREAERRLEVVDAVAALLETRKLRRGGDRVVEIAERVDEAEIERDGADPYSSPRDSVHLVDAAAAMHRDP